MQPVISKQILSIFLALTLLFSTLGPAALAEEPEFSEPAEISSVSEESRSVADPEPAADLETSSEPSETTSAPALSAPEGEAQAEAAPPESSEREPGGNSAEPEAAEPSASGNEPVPTEETPLPEESSAPAEAGADSDSGENGALSETEGSDAEDAEKAEEGEDAEEDEAAAESEAESAEARRERLMAEFPNLQRLDFGDKPEVNTKVDSSFDEYSYQANMGFMLLALDDGEEDVYDMTDEEAEALRKLLGTTKTFDDAVAETRSHMAARDEDFSITFRSDAQLSSATLYSKFWEAVHKHTGVPTEGDYLAYQWGWHNISGELASFGGQYFYTFDIEISYYNTAAQEQTANAAFQAAAKALGLTSGTLTDYEKIYRIYKFVMGKATYSTTSDYTQYTGYGAICTGKAVCQGYAVAIYRLALMAGLDARIIPNSAINHAWNIVKVGSRYYNLDATWDDTGADLSSWRNFLCGDETNPAKNSSAASKTFYDRHVSSGGYYRPNWVSAYGVSSSYYPCFTRGTLTANAVISVPSAGNEASACETGANGRCTRCGQATYQTPQVIETPAPSATPQPTETPAPSATPQPTETPAPTETPQPTATPQPTETPAPTETPQPEEETPNEPKRTVKVAVGSHMVAYANGSVIPVDSEGNITLTDDSVKAITTVEYSSSDEATNYPRQTSLKVYFITKDAEGNLTATHDSAFDGILQYLGASVRCDGSKGIRVITGIPPAALAALKGSGLNGWKLVDSGTLIGNDSALTGAVVIGSPKSAKSSFNSNPFQSYGSVDGYTNGLTFDALEQCKVTFSIRPYMSITNGTDTVTLYGGIVHRSIGYVSYQNRNAYNPTTQPTNYNYIWEIIRYCGLA